MVRMAQVVIRNGKFVDAKAVVQITHQSESSIKIDAWDCVILENGSIICNAVDKTNGAENYYSFTICANGFAILIEKEHNTVSETVRRGNVVPEGEKLEGILYLGNYFSNKNYAFFVPQKQIDFMNMYHIDVIMYRDPLESVFSLTEMVSVTKTRNDMIYSDGNLLDVARPTLPSNGNFFMQEKRYIANGASWVIIDTVIENGTKKIKMRTLYTAKWPAWELELPDFLKSLKT